MDGWTRVAHLGRTRNLNGGLVCTAADGLPFLLHVGLDVVFVPPTLRGPRQATVREITPLRSGEWEVFFSGVDTRDDADSLVGAYCLAQQNDLPAVEDEDVLLDVSGFSVVDATFGTLGHVSDLLENPAQVTLVVEGTSGQVLIPWVDAFVTHIDADARTISTDIPESLLTLNASGVDDINQSNTKGANT